MTNIIKKYEFGFTPISNKLLIDCRITPTAKCVYAYLLGKPQGWVFNMYMIKMELNICKSTFYSALNQLIEYNWIKKHQENKHGVFGHTIYEFIDKG